MRHATGEDIDFTMFELKVNAAGSWANVGRFPVAQEEAVKAACMTLAKAARNSLKFRTLDAEGGWLEQLQGRTGGMEWKKL